VNGRSNIARARFDSVAGMDRSSFNLHGNLGYNKPKSHGTQTPAAMVFWLWTSKACLAGC
jgi:hypothetical protein